MVNRYDIFLEIAKKGKLDPKEISRRDKQYHIKMLELEGLIEKDNKYLSIINNERTERLYSILRYCVNNDLDYNFYVKETIAKFLSDHFSRKKERISINTATEIRRRLEKDSFLTYLSKKPIYHIITEHTLLKEIIEYFGESYNTIQLPDKDIYNKLEKIRPKKRIEDIVPFIHTSLQLEGNLLTLRQTQKVLKNEILYDEINPKDILEATNYKRGINLINRKETIDKEDILEVHNAIMSHEEHSGTFRKEEVTIKNNKRFKICSYKIIDEELRKLIPIINDNPKTGLQELCKKGAYIHNQFQYIHPFIDGNSRTTRLIVQWYFQRHGLAFDIPIGFTSMYVSMTKGYKERDDERLAVLFALILINIAQN